MAQCAFHPGVETNVRCVSCDRYICPKDMVTTPVGYKCRECGAPARSSLGGVKPRQYALAAGAALAAGVIGGIVVGQVLAFVPFFPWLFMLLFGGAVGEATRRGSGGHRTPPIAAIATVGGLLGALVAGFGPFGLLMSAIGAAGSVLANRF